MKFPITSTFKLTDSFLSQYKTKVPPFGFNGLGEFIFLRTYSRIKESGENEQWWETIKRVVEGIYSIQKQYIEDSELEWSQGKAQKSAQEMYDRMFNFKFLPGGRSLWAMGTPLIMEKGLTGSLYNCTFVSTISITENISKPFMYAMDSLMLGVGVGFDTLGANKVKIKEPGKRKLTVVISDDREGWVASLGALLDSYFTSNYEIEFDYSLIRPEGAPIKTFGGVSSGYKPLKELHDKIRELLGNKNGEFLSARLITDVFNLIGKAVIAGNVRRSAELALGNPTEDFLDLKDYTKNPDRMDYGWASNNSIYAETGIDYKDIARRIRINGEPGIFWVNNSRLYSRMKETEKDNKDFRVSGLNPCVTGDTKIVTVYEGDKTFKELAESGKDILVYTWNPDTKLPEISMMRSPRLTRKDQELVEVTFDSGLKVKCTLDHNFYTFRGNKIMAKDLTIGQSVRAFSMSIPKDGHIRVHGWVDGKAKHQYAARMIWEYYNGKIKDKLILHHKDFTKLNNDISNLELLTNSEHNRVHYPFRRDGGFYRKNHKVVSVKLLEEREDVYNGTVDNTHTYIIADPTPISGFCSGIVSANCGEITLESYENCNLVESFPTNHETLEDFKTTIKYAYLYAKTVTLLGTQWPESNRIMLRNRRIGLSMTGLAQFVTNRGVKELETWMEEGYKTAKYYDKVYSDWFAIPLSIKLTTTKPSGTVSLLAGVTPGVHYPESNYYIRRVRLGYNSPLIKPLIDAGYNVEPAVGQESSTVVVEFPVSLGEKMRTLKDVSMWEQLNLASFAQEHWADNSVSVTVTFDPEKEGKDVENALNYFQFKLKAVSFLPKISYGAYPQMPYEEITKEKYEELSSKLSQLDFSNMFDVESVGDKYCNNETCAL
jgi:ribonucleotide reductase alpha subunit